MPKKQFYNVHNDYCSAHPIGSYAIQAWRDLDLDGDCEFVPSINGWAGCGDCLALARVASVYNCSNAFLKPGQFTKPHATYMSGSHPNIGDACYLFQPLVIAGDIIQSLDGECKSLFGNATVCYDTAGNVISCTVGLPGKYWKTYPCAWKEFLNGANGGHFGACLQMVEWINTTGGGAGKWWIWKGCPTGTIDEQLSNWYAGGLFSSVQYGSGAGGQFYHDGGFDNRAHGSNSFTGGDGTGNTYNPGTFISGITNFNPANVNGTDGVTVLTTLRYGCFEAFRTGSCPEFMSTDPTESRRCVVETRAAICPSGYTLHTSDYNPSGPHVPFTTPPYCVREYEALLPNPNRSSWVRGAAGSLFVVGNPIGNNAALNFLRYMDVLPESSFFGYTLDTVGLPLANNLTNANIHVDTSNHLHVFYLRGRDTGGATGWDTWDVYHIRSENSGYSFTPRVAGPIHETDNIRVSGWKPDGTSEVYFVTQEKVCEGNYQIVRTHYGKSGQLLVFGYRDGKWWVRSCERNDDGTWDSSDEEEVIATDDSTCDGIQELEDGKIVFLCYSSTGKLQRLLSEKIGKDALGDWEPEDLLDALAEEYYSFAVHLAPGGDIATCLVWKPNQLGRVWDGPNHQGGFTHLGKIYTRVAERQDDGTWDLKPEVLAWDPGGTLDPQHGTLRKRRDHKHEYRGGSGSKVSVNLDSEGSGTWSNA